MSARPAITAVGLSACSGDGVENAWKFVLQDSSLMRRQSLFDSPINGFRLFACAPRSAPRRGERLPNCERLLLSALDEALGSAGIAGFDARRVGTFVGTSIGNVFETENALVKMLREKGAFDGWNAMARHECSSLADAAARFAGAKGPRFAVSTACSSSGLALAAACAAISAGKIDAALVCGVDALSRITVNGFASLQLLSNGVCRPFDRDRDGINLGEAAGVAVVARSDAAEKLGLEILAEVSACSCTADAYHATAPHPEAEGVERAMRNALNAARLSPNDIGFYCAHGTGTAANDAAEAAALEKVFGVECAPPFASLKGKFGHSLGASGIVNAAISIKAMREDMLPRNFGFENADEKIRPQPLRSNTPKKVDHILFSSLGFGGNNACAIISKKGKARPLCAVKPARIFLIGAGAVCGTSVGRERVMSAPDARGRCDVGSLLPGIPALKKRRWAKLQQMALNAAIEAAQGLPADIERERACACIGTGLGMTQQTLKFIENAIENGEANPLPTAFTNSVHNAPAAAISMHLGLKGLNSAVSAREASFECALWQAELEMSSSAADWAIAGACDEYCECAEKFMSEPGRFAEASRPFSEVAAAYLISRQPRGGAFAEVLSLDIRDCERRPEDEARALSEQIASCGAAAGDVRTLIIPFSYNKFQRRYMLELAEKASLPSPVFLEERFGLNYSVSALAPLAAAEAGGGIHVAFTKTSTGQRASTILKIL